MKYEGHCLFDGKVGNEGWWRFLNVQRIFDWEWYLCGISLEAMLCLSVTMFWIEAFLQLECCAYGCGYLADDIAGTLDWWLCLKDGPVILFSRSYTRRLAVLARKCMNVYIWKIHFAFNSSTSCCPSLLS